MQFLIKKIVFDIKYKLNDNFLINNNLYQNYNLSYII